jgi:hypothetical protein
VLAEARFDGDIAELEFDDSLSHVVVWALIAMLVAVAGLGIRPLQGFFGALAIVIPVGAVVWLIQGPSPPGRTLRIYRQERSVAGAKGGKVKEVCIGEFNSVLVQHMRLRRAGVQYTVRLVTSRGPLLIHAFPMKEQADDIARKIAAWLGVKVIDGGRLGLLSAAYEVKNDIHIWR